MSFNGFGSKTSNDVRCAFYCKDKSAKDRLIYAQFNPKELEYGHSATYAEMTSPGMNYPIFQYVRGNANSFQIDLFLYEGYNGDGKDIRYTEEWFKDCLPPDENQKPTKVKKSKKKKKSNKIASAYVPPVIDIRFGYYKVKAILTGMKINDKWFNDDGDPIMSQVTLDFTQVGHSTYF